MQVHVNGEPQGVNDGTTVSELLELRGVKPIRVAVEINESILSRKQFSATTLHEGDKIEIVTLVGGG